MIIGLLELSLLSGTILTMLLVGGYVGFRLAASQPIRWLVALLFGCAPICFVGPLLDHVVGELSAWIFAAVVPSSLIGLFVGGFLVPVAKLFAPLGPTK